MAQIWTTTRKHGQGQPIAKPRPRTHIVRGSPARPVILLLNPPPTCHFSGRGNTSVTCLGRLMLRYAENHLASILSSPVFIGSVRRSFPSSSAEVLLLSRPDSGAELPSLFLHLGPGADAEVTVKWKHSNERLTMKECIWTWLSCTRVLPTEWIYLDTCEPSGRSHIGTKWPQTAAKCERAWILRFGSFDLLKNCQIERVKFFPESNAF